jgi:hypothetical protein
MFYTLRRKLSSATRSLSRSAARPPRPYPARLAVESLEGRLVPSTISYTPAASFVPGQSPAGLLQITGTSGSDNVSVRFDVRPNPIFTGATINQLVVNDNGTDRVIDQGINQNPGNIVIQYSDGGGSDTFVNNTNLPATMTASDFVNDNYTGGTGQNTFIMNGVYGSDTFIGRGNSNSVVDHVGVSGRTTVLTDTALTTSGLTFGITRQNTTTLGDIQQVEIDGGGHNEVIDARGFSGSTVLRGGGAGGTIYGGRGNDDITTSSGGYVVFDILGQNTFHTQSGDQLFGLANRTLSNAELSQTGSLMVSLQGDSLVFNGPSGGGFRITGSWREGMDSQGREYFTATSTTLTLKTGLGDVPLPNVPLAPLTIYTKPSSVANGGVYASIGAGNVDIAPLGTATQSSTAFGGLASNAIDGNTDGNFFDGSVTHTDDQPNSYWQVQLPSAAPLAQVVLWNRSDCCGTRLSNFTVTVSNGNQVVFQHAYFATGSVAQGGSFAVSLPAGTIGDRVRIQLNGHNNDGNGYLSLAEVQVFTPVGGLNLNLGDATGPLSSFFNSFGLSLSTPSVQYGIGLGGDLSSNLQLPLANALPYFYFGAGTGFSLQFGTASVDTGGQSLALAFDPADPSLFVKVSNFAFGGSLHGYIPFTPLQKPSALASSIASTNGVAGYGNLFAMGSIDLGEIPVTLGGAIVIGLDVNHTGTPLGLNGTNVQQLIHGQLSLASLAGQALSDVFVGVNGTVGVGYEKDGFNFSVQVGQGTAIYEPGIFACHAASLDPFAGTFLDPVLHPSASVVADGYIRNQNDFNLHLAESNSVLFGLVQATGNVNIGNNGVGVDFLATSPLGGGKVHLTGNIYADGSFNVTGSMDFSLDAYVATVYCHADFTFGGSFTTGVSFGAHLSAGVQLGNDELNLHAGVDASLYFSIDSSGFHIKGDGSVGAGLTIFGVSADVSLGVGFSDSGFTIYLPSWLPFGNISANW